MQQSRRVACHCFCSSGRLILPVATDRLDQSEAFDESDETLPAEYQE